MAKIKPGKDGIMPDPTVCRDCVHLVKLRMAPAVNDANPNAIDLSAEPLVVWACRNAPTDIDPTVSSIFDVVAGDRLYLGKVPYKACWEINRGNCPDFKKVMNLDHLKRLYNALPLTERIAPQRHWDETFAWMTAEFRDDVSPTRVESVARNSHLIELEPPKPMVKDGFWMRRVGNEIQ